MDSSNTVRCERRQYTQLRQSHAHPYEQLILPLEGCLYIETNPYKIKLDREHLFFLPSASMHTFYASDRNEFLVLDIPIAVFGRVIENTSRTPRLFALDERWSALRTLFMQEAAGASDGSLIDLTRYAGGLLFRQDRPVSLQYIHAHYNMQICVADLAKMEHFSTAYYIQWFASRTGMTPSAYIQHVRLEKAKELLMQGNLSLLEIAQSVGYAHQSSLTRLFYQREKRSPLNYRRMQKEDK